MALTQMINKKLQTEEAATTVLVFIIIALGGWQLGTAKKSSMIYLGWGLLSLALLISFIMGIFIIKTK
jgi:hypothetical protein